MRFAEARAFQSFVQPLEAVQGRVPATVDLQRDLGIAVAGIGFI